MIILSPSLIRRLERETSRHLGTYAQLVFYSGTMPVDCDHSADGEKILTQEPLPEDLLPGLTKGREPMLPDRAKFWRVLDNGGICVMQGDGAVDL